MLVSQGIQKNLNFTLRLSGYFFDRCGIKILCPVPWWSHGFRYNYNDLYLLILKQMPDLAKTFPVVGAKS